MSKFDLLSKSSLPSKFGKLFGYFNQVGYIPSHRQKIVAKYYLVYSHISYILYITSSAICHLLSVVEQGEGTRGNWHQAHYGKFLRIMEEYRVLKHQEPNFEPARPDCASSSIIRILFCSCPESANSNPLHVPISVSPEINTPCPFSWSKGGILDSHAWSTNL
jgi:hypothetical protein